VNHVIIELVRSAYHCRHTVAVELALCIRRAREGYESAATKTVRTEAQGRMVKSVMERNSALLARLSALHGQYASFRGELGTLPTFRDKAAKCDPALAAMARATQDEVFERAVRSLGGG